VKRENETKSIKHPEKKEVRADLNSKLRRVIEEN